MKPRFYRSRRLAGILPLLALTACAVNPATGERQLIFMSEAQEIELGRESDASVVASYGLVDDAELQAYVSEIGMSLAAASEKPELPWSFKVVDDPIVNAFALPGGFIYVTRGILAQFDSEAELAGVLGHEIGHVTARHSANRMSRQQVLQGALGVGMIFSETVARYGQVGAAGLQVLSLRFSRGDETQSDELGLRYMTRDGYDPEAMIGVFRMLAQTGGSAEGRLPEWQLTHPYPENREDNMRQLIAEQGLPTGGRVDRDEYLDAIDGIVYGDDPRHGYFEGTRFLHPDLAFEITFPAGWATVNQRSVVAAISPDEDGVMTLEVAEGDATPEAQLREFLRQDGVRGGTIRRDDSSGLERASADFEIQTQEGTIAGVAAFARLGDVTYRILGYAAERDWIGYSRAGDETIASFLPVTDRAVLDVQPLRLDIVRISEPMSLIRFNEANPSPIDIEALARLNRTSPNAVLAAGTAVKRVVGVPVG